MFGPRPYSYWGAETTEAYSPDVTGEITEKLVERERKSRQAVLHLVGAGGAAPRGRRDDADGPPGPDPRPAPRYEEASKGYTLPRPPSFNEADLSDKPSNFRSTRRRR